MISIAQYFSFYLFIQTIFSITMKHLLFYNLRDFKTFESAS